MNQKVAEKSQQPETFDLRTQDIAGDKVQELLRLFPEIRTEDGKLDFDRLKLDLGQAVDVGKERYGMNWPGKADCFKTIQAPSIGTLLPCPKESVDFDSTENLIIEGDNLEVLKLFQKPYLGKIKTIYIDPPYNTGNDFIYPDNYTESLQTYLEYTSQVDAEGRKFGTNAEADGRFHSKWLNMMYPRLTLARNLLRPDGLIFVSIDDNEVSTLRAILSEIFGEENFEGHIHWRRRHNQPNDPTKMLALVAEHVLCYAKDKAAYKAAGVGKIALTGNFSNPDNDPRGDWASKPWKVGSDQSGTRYKITTPTGRVYDEEWMGEISTFEDLRKDNRIIFPDKGNGSPRKKYFRNEREEEGQCATNWWPPDKFGHNQAANSQLEEIFGQKNVFSNPKPLELLGGIIDVSDTKGSDIILDFFAGSGTTAHATFQRNQADHGNRRFILVQLPEPLDPEKSDQKVAADYCDKLKKPRLISELTKERVRRAANSTKNEQPLFNGDFGFRVFKLSESNFTTWNTKVAPESPAIEKQLELHVDHIREKRTDDDILYELLIKSGFPLTTHVTTMKLEGKSVYSISDGAMLLCLERKLTLELIRAMAAMKPERVVCLDEGFAGNDQLKANAVQIFKTKGVTSFKTV